MRDLLLMHGIQGSGKSTFIKENNLEPYTICPDKLRLLFEAPIIDPRTGKKSISQKNDKKVWDLVNKLVEEKMARGEFIVIDAMNIDMSTWKKLAEKYRYHIYYKSFLNISLEECIKRNKQREEYKIVSDEVIYNCYERINNAIIPKYTIEIDDDFFKNGIKPIDVNKYENIYVFGDIHGCFDPLNQFFTEHPFSKNNLYIFLGDYLDRGLKNKETIELLFQFINEKNVMFLEGNHSWEKYWANNEIEKIRSREFLINTVNQINSVDKAKLREFCRRWIQMAYIEYNNKKYFLTHAGLGFFPGEKNLRFIPSHDLIRGGKYEDDIDAWYEEKDCDVIQIHGHRNQYEYSVNQFTQTFNLNSSVEFGEPLRVMQISKQGYNFYHYENDSCKGRINPWKQNIETNNIALTMSKSNLTKEEQFILTLRKSNDIIEKILKNNISSFNFKRDVFYSNKWNNLNKIARGLFINTKENKIVARSYEKFFNVNEGNKNTFEFLKQNLKYPISVFMKYNGFLGLMSYDHNINDLHFFSKSTDESDFAYWFKEIAIQKFKQYNKLDEIKEYLKNNDVTMIFEVIDPTNDPHIIQYKSKDIWLLDIIDNTIDFHKKSYDELCKIANKFQLNVKQKEYIINNFDELMYNLNNEFPNVKQEIPFEGFVLEDKNGYMFKFKMSFYLFWKKIRAIKQQIAKNKFNSFNKLNEEERKIVTFITNNFNIDEIDKMSVIDIRNKFNMQGNK